MTESNPALRTTRLALPDGGVLDATWDPVRRVGGYTWFDGNGTRIDGGNLTAREWLDDIRAILARGESGGDDG